MALAPRPSNIGAVEHRGRRASGPSNQEVVMRGWWVLVVWIALVSGGRWCDAAWEARILDSGDVVHLGDTALIERSDPTTTVTTRSVNLAFILDASGSMNAKLESSGRSRLVVAKEVLRTLIPQVPAQINASLWMYGHRLPKDPQSESCTDIEQVIGLAPFDADAFIAAIDAVEARGYTPIAASIEQAAATLPAGDDQLNAILLVSDGEETCDGEPCELAATLHASDAAVVVHVVGYAVDEATQEQLRCIAEASGGTYADADGHDALLAALQSAVEATVSHTILRVETSAPDGEEVHTNLWLFAEGSSPRDLVSGYKAWTNNNVPPATCDLVVRSLPWILYPALPLVEGTTTTVRIALAELTVLMPDRSPTRFELHDAEVAARLGAYDGTIAVAPGTYAVSSNRSMGEPITLDPGERREVVLGTIRVTDPGGKAARAAVHDEGGDYLGTYSGDIVLVPGTYRVAVNGSLSAPLRVEDGGTHDMTLGGVRCIAPDGTRLGATVFDTERKRLGHHRGDILLVPGSYVLEVNGSELANVAIGAGSFVDIALGAIENDARYEIHDAAGKRLGSFDGVTVLFPGTYSVTWNKQTVEGVVVTAGETAQPQ
jgi:Mg-chelatase subunit ChlD